MQQRKPYRHLAWLTTALLCVLTAGCGSIGPRSLDRDQLDYGHSLGNSWKNQMLSNVVKIRFVDMPVFVDVSSIVSGYTLQTQLTGRLDFAQGDSNSQSVNAGGSYTDRPTISFTPKSGDDYLRSLLRPVEPQHLLALVQAGYSAQLLFTWTVEAVNGLRNYSESISGDTEADPGFLELANLLQELQNARAIGFDIVSNDQAGEHNYLILSTAGLPDAVQIKRRRVLELLGLDPDRNRFDVIYGPVNPDNTTLAIQTRSILQTLYGMAGFVDVPASQLANALPGYKLEDPAQRPLHVRSGKDRPEVAFASIRYKGYWYWIDDADLESKRVFTLMLFMTTLTNHSTGGQGPLLTIPTG